jgi:hypothetical protein
MKRVFYALLVPFFCIRYEMQENGGTFAHEFFMDY